MTSASLIDVYKRQPHCAANDDIHVLNLIFDTNTHDFFPGKLKMMEKKRPQNFLLTGMRDVYKRQILDHPEREARVLMTSQVVRQ